MNEDYFGYVAAILTTFAFVPQLVRIYKTKSAEDISLIMLVTFMIGLIFWIVYAIKSNSLPVLLANSITLSLNLVILILKLIYKAKEI